MENEEVGLSNFVNFYCDRKIIKSFSGCAVHEGNKKRHQLYIELVGKKLITLSFENNEDYQVAFNILNKTTKEEVKSKMSIVK